MNSPSVEQQIVGFIAKYSPEMGRQISGARQLLRPLFPRGHELVYDNYNALVFAFSPTSSSAQAFLSVAGYPRWISLFFSQGVDLLDPHGLLQGSGSRVRSIRLRSPQQIMEPSIQALILQALEPHREAMARAAELTTTIKSISVKQRARRAPPTSTEVPNDT